MISLPNCFYLRQRTFTLVTVPPVPINMNPKHIGQCGAPRIIKSSRNTAAVHPAIILERKYTGQVRLSSWDCLACSGWRRVWTWFLGAETSSHVTITIVTNNMHATAVSLGGAPGCGVTTLEGAQGVGHSLVGEWEHTGLASGSLTGVQTENEMQILQVG